MVEEEQSCVSDLDGSMSKSITQQIISDFLTVLVTKPGFEEIAKRLKNEIVPNSKASEIAIRRALFGEDES